MNNRCQSQAIVLLLLVSTILTGCEKSPPTAVTPTSGGNQGDSQEMMARVDAAMRIVSHNDKDSALGVACRDAANAGASDAVKKGLANIVSHNLCDEVAADFAIALQKSGKTAEATEVTEFITSQNKKDEVLKSLASGS